MLKVLNVEERTDKFGKKYNYITLFSPEQKVKLYQKSKLIERIAPSKTCSYVAYEINYSKNQKSDPQYHLKKGDIIPGRIVTRDIKPTISNGDVITRCTVPVFCDSEDPIEFEIALIKAFKRAGKELDRGQLQFGEETKMELIIPEMSKIPEKCLIVKTID